MTDDPQPIFVDRLPSVRGVLGDLVRGAIWSFFGTLGAMAALALGLSAVALWLLQGRPWGYQAFAVLLIVVQTALLAVWLASKQAISGTLLRAVGKLSLGRVMVKLLFDRITRSETVYDGTEATNPVPNGLMSLNQFEDRLGSAVQSFQNTGAPGAWLVKWLEAHLLGAVRAQSLKTAREQFLPTQTINLAAIQETLGQTIDRSLTRRMRWGLWLWSAVALLGLLALIALQIWLIWASST